MTCQLQVSEETFFFSKTYQIVGFLFIFIFAKQMYIIGSGERQLVVLQRMGH